LGKNKKIIELLEGIRNDKITSKIIRESLNTPSDPNAIEYLVNKIKFKYNNDDIKKKINDLLGGVIEDLKTSCQQIEDFIDKMKSTYNYFIENQNNISDKPPYVGIPIGERIDKLKVIFEEYHDMDSMTSPTMDITDIFFLRRFLDKEYITNAIIYTGGYHSMNYANKLIKHFGFKMTNASHLNGDHTVESVTNLIKNNNYSIEGLIQFFYESYQLIQCSDLTNFPDNFE
jgi:hypothetical protein